MCTKEKIRQSSKNYEISKAMDGIEDDLFQMDSFDSSVNNFEDYSQKKVQESFSIPVTIDSSYYKNSTNNNASDYNNPGLLILCYAGVFSFQVCNFWLCVANFSTKVLLFKYRKSLKGPRMIV